MKVELRNFRGVESLDVEIGKATVLAGMPGTGKTTVLAAVKAALDGNVPTTDIGPWGTAASVTLTLDDGTEIERRRTASATKTVLNGRQTTAASAEAYITEKMGAPMAAIGSMMGQGAWKGLKDKDIAAVLFAVLPTNPPLDDALALAKEQCGLTDAGETAVRERFAPKSARLGDAEASQVYKAAFASRTEANREVKRLEAVVASVPAPTSTKEEVQKWMVDVAAQEAQLAAYDKAVAEHAKAAKAAEDAAKRKAAMEQRAYAPGIPGVQEAEAAVLAAEAKAKAATKEKDAASAAVRKLEAKLAESRGGVKLATNEKEAAAKEEARLAGGACLAMDGLACPHVKELARAAKERREEAEVMEFELGMNAEEDAAALAEARNALGAAEAAVNAANAAYREAVSVQGQARAVASARESAAAIVVPEVPDLQAPPAIDAADVQRRRDAAMAELSAIANWERAQADAADLARLRKDAEALSNVCDVFGPKGTFRDAVLRRVLSPLEKKANAAAAAACPGMELRFSTSGAGFEVLLRPKPGVVFRPLADASTGEFTLAAYLLMRVMGSVRNPGILVLDNLDGLDAASFGRLVAAIAADPGVPHALVATVDHSDTMDAVAAVPGADVVML